MTLTVLASLFLLVSPQQNPAPQTPAGPKGAIEGLVIHATTKEPIAGARVTISRVQSAPTALPVIPGTLPPGATVAVAAPPSAPGATPPRPPTIPAGSTDPQGKFSFKDVEPGLYTLQVANNGFARAEYGQRIVGTPGRPVTVVADQTLKDLVIQLTPAGYVSGRVRDLAGQPVVGVQVQLIKATYGPTGQRTFQMAGNTRTNDRGEYRLYWVTPGRYYLNAGSTQGAPVNIGGGGASPNEVQDVYVSTFYPNVTDISFATSLNVQPANEISGIDLSISKQQLYRIRGRLIDARTDRPPQAATFTISSRAIGGGGFMMTGGANTRYNPDGTFEIRDMAPGNYGISALVTEVSGILPGSPTAQQNQPRAQVNVTVVNADVDNLLLTIVPLVSLQGRLSIEGQPLTAITSLDRIRVQLTTTADTTSFIVAGGQSASPAAGDGTFKIENVLPGDYRAAISGLPPGYYLKSVRLEQIEGIDQPLRVTSSPSGGLEIVISPNGGQIDGTIVDEKQQPVRDTQAVLIPERQRNRFDLYTTARSDQNGRFTFRGVPPGDYKIFAWETLEQFAYYDAEVMRFYEARGKLLHVTESSTQTAEVRLIPPAEP